MQKKDYRDRFHGRVDMIAEKCARPGCSYAGEFRAPAPDGRQPGPNGPGEYQYLCLDHIREFNAGYDWFAGMTAEEIAMAQHPASGWADETRAFSTSAGIDSPPKWADFHDPLDAISTRFRGGLEKAAPRQCDDGHHLTSQDRKALRTLGLGDDANRSALRRAYSDLVRKYHPDRNGGNRRHEKALQDVISAYTHLRNIPAFT